MEQSSWYPQHPYSWLPKGKMDGSPSSPSSLFLMVAPYPLPPDSAGNFLAASVIAGFPVHSTATPMGSFPVSSAPQQVVLCPLTLARHYTPSGRDSPVDLSTVEGQQPHPL